jgi:hypothetical protein
LEPLRLSRRKFPLGRVCPTRASPALSHGMGVTDGQPMVPRPGMSRREKLELWQARRAAVAVQVRSLALRYPTLRPVGHTN